MNKDPLRKHFFAIRKDISDKRRWMASENCLIDLKSFLSPFQKILSFHSVKSEINLRPLNDLLASEKRLYMPTHDLLFYQVVSLSKDLKEVGNGFFEPNPTCCPPVSLEEIHCILVPGLSFDLEGRRLGYGKGHYDQILSRISQKTITVGVAFQEQLSLEPLPEELHDVKVSHLKLF